MSCGAWSVRSWRCTIGRFIPPCRRWASIGQFALQGPYFPLLELQGRWIAGLWSGTISPPAEAEMHESVRRPPVPMVAHNVLAVDFSEAAGVAPDLSRHPDLAEPLLFGPMLPARYRLDGPGTDPDAPVDFQRQVAASPRAPVEPEDAALVSALGLVHLLPASA